jgi:hypothetical protein
MGAVGYFCILYLSERATTMPNVYALELVIIAGNHRGTRTAVELYATPCDVACDGQGIAPRQAVAGTRVW